MNFVSLNGHNVVRFVRAQSIANVARLILGSDAQEFGQMAQGTQNWFTIHNRSKQIQQQQIVCFRWFVAFGQ